MQNTSNLYRRQANWLTTPIDQVLLVGAGTIGSWTALCLNKIGVKAIDIYDADRVEAHNTPNQYYSEYDAGNNKASTLLERLDGYAVEWFDTWFTADSRPRKEPQIVIAATDNMTSRLTVAKYARDIGAILVDARLGRSLIEVYCLKAANTPQWEKYLADAHSFTDLDAPDLPDCGAVSTAATGMIVAGLIVESLVDCHCGRDWASFRMFNTHNGLSETTMIKSHRPAMARGLI